ncbi:MAG: divalent metal cation transporter [Planctomycetaceae bacterium]|jgi:Mn2+/Fe2+ NRAMP family transporter|nr:divalent metal cation transporter [Planctomycetaceae bacterium]
MDKLNQEKEHLLEIASRPLVPRALGYIRMTGPGLLQSAMTLGAGSAAASVVAGASFGYKLLWVQPIAMFLGVMMFAALSNVVLTTQERPYWGFMRETGKIWKPFAALIFLWGLGSIMSSVIWHFPQYGLAAGAARSMVEQFAPNMTLAKSGIYTTAGYAVSYAAGLLILCINIVVVFNYGRGGVGIRIYEWFLRCMIALVFLTFLLVVVINFHKIQWLEMFRGFTGFYAKEILYDKYDPKTITTVLGMLGAAVGINMTFMYPYSLLKKGWGKEHKTLAKWDLGLTMFLPFVIVTSLVMIGLTVSGIYDGTDIVNSGIKPLDAAKALHTDWISPHTATLIFCGGLFGMTCGAISTHMTCCGFTMCEMLGLEPTTWRFRLFALTPVIGFFGVAVNLPFWFPVAASAVCFTMLPIAYITFLLMNNRRSYIGAAVGKGFSRWLFNAVLVIALIAATIGAGIALKTRVYDELKKHLTPDKPAVTMRLNELKN